MRSPRSLIAASALGAAALLAGLAPQAAHATFPGDRGRIAYETLDAIHSVKPDGSGDRKILGTRAHEPQWSADGRQILYHRDWYSLWRAKADGSGKRQILQAPAHLQIHGAAWAPDGARVAVELHGERRIPGTDDDEVESVHHVYTVRVDGTGLRRLHAGRNPAWSPDGHRIAFATDQGVATIRPDGSGFRLLRRVDGAFGPDFSPDGRRLAYHEWSKVLHVVDLATGRHRALRPLGSGPNFLIDATWTPDGSRIAYLHRTVPAEGPWPPTRVYTIEPDGSSKRLLMEMPQARQPEGFSWQPLR